MQTIELRPGQVVELDLLKSKDEILQFRTLVESCDGDTEFVLLAPMYKAMPYPFHEQDVVDLIYTLHDEENKPHTYVFKVQTVERFRRKDLTYLRVVRTSEVTKLQRRGFYRLNYVAYMNYEVMPDDPKENPSESRTVITRDISAGGFKGVVTEKIPVGALLRIHLDLGSEPIVLTAKTISCSHLEDSKIRYEVRAEYTALSTKETSALIQAINHMQIEYIRKVAATSLEERLASYSHDELLYSERRNHRDWILWWLEVANTVSVLIAILIISNFAIARPVTPGRVYRSFFTNTRMEWDMNLIWANGYYVLALFIITAISLILNSFRLRRQGDHYRMSLVVLAASSLVVLALYILFR